MPSGCSCSHAGAQTADPAAPEAADGLPAILAGLRVAVVLALVGAVVAEFMGASQGLGAVVIAAQE
jgi:ABC-type nitrate/sulfonate/bicarbonate transport system permease component